MKTAVDTQQFLPFADVREGIVIMKDGSFRAVGMVSAINFALKSEKEQNAIVYQYQNFLNSLSSPIEIVMQSKRLDLTAYLKQLKTFEDKEVNELLRMQIADYRAFVEKLITVANIMDKRFYVVIPFNSAGFKPSPGSITGASKGPIKITETQFRVAQQELNQRLGTVTSGLNGIGLQVATLNTQQLVELLYGTFNPDEAETQKLDEVENLQGAVVERQPPRPDEFPIPPTAPAPADTQAQAPPLAAEQAPAAPKGESSATSPLSTAPAQQSDPAQQQPASSSAEAQIIPVGQTITIEGQPSSAANPVPPSNQVPHASNKPESVSPEAKTEADSVPGTATASSQGEQDGPLITAEEMKGR